LCCPAPLACGNHSGEAEHLSGIGLKLFGFIPEPLFTFIPESCSRSSRNTVRNHPGIAFTLSRIPHDRKPFLCKAPVPLLWPPVAAEHAPSELSGSGSPGSILTNADEATGQDVLDEPPQKLRGTQPHFALIVAVSIVLPAERDMLAIKCEESVIADFDAMSVTAEIP
jgi:hypothetical protein